MADYFSIHNVAEAHKISKGKGVKVGIIDWLFEANKFSNLYNNKVDLTENLETLNEMGWHGRLMATTLRQIAPECEIIAINAIVNPQFDKNDNFYYLKKAIDWAIKNKLNILTCSQPKIDEKYREELHEYIKKANNAGIITTFIHCDDELNFWPWGCLEFKEAHNFKRQPDFNIFHYDYNNKDEKRIQEFNEKIKNGIEIKSGNEIPYFSFSSTSPVLAGFIALIKSKNKNLSINEIREILTKSTYRLEKTSDKWHDAGGVDKVIDISKALKSL